MAKPVTEHFSGFKVYLGDGDDPEVFEAPCAFTQRSLSLTTDLGETIVPDCADEDAAAWIERDKTTKSASIEGEGVLSKADLEKWRAFDALPGSKNCRVEFSGDLAAGGGYYGGKFHMTKLEFRGQRGQRVTIAVSLSNDGPVTWVAAAA